MNSLLRSARTGMTEVMRRLRARQVAGHLDDLQDGAVRGWAWSPADPEQRLLIDVFVEGRFAGQCLANLHRPDLEEARIGDGRHAFQLNLPPEFATTSLEAIRVYALQGVRHELRQAPEPVRRERPMGRDAYIRATFSALVFSPSVEPAKTAPPATGRRAYDRLFAPTAMEELPPIFGSPLTAYLDHVRHRHDQARRFDTTTSKADYAAYLKYYLETYCRRRGRLRAPLPSGDIERLNEGPSAESPLAPSLAQRLLQDADGSDGLEQAFIWAAYDSAAYGVEDCLVSEAQANWLRACDGDADLVFPLSRFMRRFLSGNPFLKQTTTSDEDERKFAYFALLLFATTSPHLIRLMPEAWVDRFLNGPDAPFDVMLRRVFGPRAFTSEAWRRCVAAHHYDVRSRRFSTLSAQGDRLYAPAATASNDAIVDVQVIGPFSRRLGISDSCLSLARALDALPFSTRFCDFTLDHPNVVRTQSDRRTSKFGRAHVNILHLNLEEMPTAFAYLPDIFTGSHIIGVPYLETPRVGSSQRLGRSLVDEIWTASKFVADAVDAPEKTHIVGSACRPLQPIGRANARRQAYDGVAGPDDFVFLTACDALSGAHRKNPIGVVRAFLNAFPDDADVKLVVKTHSLSRVGDPEERRLFERLRDIAAECPRIIWIDRFLEDAGHSALIEGADALVSLHRAEGFGYHILEAMTLGTPVVATAYSGNLEFCNAATAQLIPYALTHIEHGQYHRASASQTWAEPDFAASVAAMRHLRDDRAAREQMAANAKAFAESHFSLDAFARRIEPRLRRILDKVKDSRVA